MSRSCEDFSLFRTRIEQRTAVSMRAEGVVDWSAVADKGRRKAGAFRLSASVPVSPYVATAHK